jgi:hypothetical protein
MDHRSIIRVFDVKGLLHDVDLVNEHPEKTAIDGLDMNNLCYDTANSKYMSPCILVITN